MIKWQLFADNAALMTATGIKTGGAIQVRDAAGCALYGPYLDLPAGQCTARIRVGVSGAGQAMMDITADMGGTTLASRLVDLAAIDGHIELGCRIDSDAAACEIRLLSEQPISIDIVGVEIDLVRDRPAETPQPDRPVGWESRKTYADKIASGFLDRYLSGPAVLEIGYKGYMSGTVPIVPQAIGVDLGYPGYDGVTLPFADESFDAIYSSHCFEHIPDYVAVLRDWYRLLKVGGHLIIVVPHHYLFERRRYLPSISNIDHQRFYTPESLLLEVAEAYPPNTYRVRRLQDNDDNFDYSLSGRESLPPCFEIELVIEKIRKPFWNLDDNSVRPYSAPEFSTEGGRRNPWSIDLDFSQPGEWRIAGPNVPLQFADYEAEFFFDAIGLGDQPLSGTVQLDVLQWYHTGYVSRAALVLEGETGATALRRGSVRLRFSHDEAPETLFIFRTNATAPPFAGILRFKGVVLRYAAQAAPLE